MEQLLAQVAGRDVVNLPETATRVQQFYAGKTVFITGGTGTVGKLLVAKLLQCCPNIEKIFLLIRVKNVHHIGIRHEELMRHPVFDDVRYDNPELMRKMHFIRGDLTLKQMGVCEEDAQTLVNETEIIFHLGGTTLFDEDFKTSAEVNVRALQHLLALAKRMKSLKVLLHVSTLFANCHKNVLEEEFDRPFISGKALIEFVESMDPNLRYRKPINLGQCPNNFVFTKRIAEELVRNENRNLPVVLVRLPLIISSDVFPSRGFTDNVNSLMGLTMTSYLGLNKSILAKKEASAEVFPADMAANALICIAWDTAQTKALNDNVEVPNEDRFLIYNITTSKSNQLTWQLFFMLTNKFCQRFPSIFTLSLPWYILQDHKSWHFFFILIFHYIPGYLVDFMTLYLFYTTKYMGYYSKIDMLSRSLAYFTLNGWDVKSNGMRRLQAKLDETDKDLFNFDPATIDWETYFEYYVRGIRKFVLKDADSSLPMARQDILRRLLSFAFKMGILGAILITLVCRYV